MYKYILLLHVLGATIWTGGHLVLCLTVLPRAMRNKSTKTILQFESGYEKLGIPALIIQIITGLWLAHHLLPDMSAWFSLDNLVSNLIALKLLLLFLTAGFAAHARLRIIPSLKEETLTLLAYHIIFTTVTSVLFVFIGVSFRVGGFF